MALHTSTLVAAALLIVGMFGFAFVAAPHSCEWGLKAYVLTGIAVALAVATLPWLLETRASPGWRALFSVAFLGAAVAGWIGGLFAANVRLMCRLF